MKEKLDELTIDNFRVFAGSNTFKFTDLNIYTGANNSGKSTIIKAIKLFSEGLAKSDFPALNLITEDSNLGSYDCIVNKFSGKKNFKVGFTTKIAAIDETFRIVYTFSDGKENDEQFRETALFANLEVINPDGVVFLGIYASFPHDEDERFEVSVDFPSESGDPGLVYFRLNVSLLEKYLPSISDIDFSPLLEQLNLIKGRDNYWWGEAFNEDDYSLVNYDISTLHLKDFLEDLLLDPYFNLAEYDSKKTLYFGDNNGDNLDFLRQGYIDFLESVNYLGFVRQVIHPILAAIKSGLDLFRNNNVLHIVSDITQERLIKNNNQSEYLQRLYRTLDVSENVRFIRESFALFNIDGLVEIITHLNSAFEINLITDVSATRLKTIRDAGEPGTLKNLSALLWESMSDYESNPRINIADLGKGTANIIKLVLKIASILFAYREEKKKNVDLRERQGRESEPFIKKTILIEEPEAFLHPNWQSRLVDFFFYCLKEYDVQFIVETHSVYLIQRLQFLVAKGEFDPEHATILYFNPNDKDEKFYRLNIRKDGILRESFGTGFYDETANLTADILNAQNIN